jgi:hypothetical protein
VLVHRPGTRAALGRVIHLPISICMPTWVSKGTNRKEFTFPCFKKSERTKHVMRKKKRG